MNTLTRSSSCSSIAETNSGSSDSSPDGIVAPCDGVGDCGCELKEVDDGAAVDGLKHGRYTCASVGFGFWKRLGPVQRSEVKRDVQGLETYARF